MAYEKQNWQSNELLTSEKLNHMEDGIAEFNNATSYKVTGPQSVVSVSDAIEAKAGKVIVNIEAVQAGSGDPSPENVRPISGWTGANVTRTGFNVFNGVTQKGGLDYFTGVEISNTNLRRSEYLQVVPNIDYYFGSINTAPYITVWYDENKNYIRTNEVNPTRIITSPNNAKFVRIAITNNNYATNWDTANICINLSDPSKNGTYEPGHVVTYPISWQSEAGTVYGGTLDVTTGLLTMNDDGTGNLVVTHGFKTFTGAEGYSFMPYSSETLYAESNILPDVKKQTNDIWGICNMVSTGTDGTINRNYIDKPSRYSNGIEFKNVLSFWGLSEQSSTALNSKLAEWYANGTPLQIMYELATPQTYQLTPVEIEMLLGDNNVWADTGDITVGYLREDSLGTGEAIADAIKNLDASHGQMVKVAMTKTFNDAIEVTTPMFSTLPKTFAAVGITPDHELVQDGFAYLSNPSALGSDWTINTGDNEIQISGTCNDSTYIKASFCVKQKTTATA